MTIGRVKNQKNVVPKLIKSKACHDIVQVLCIKRTRILLYENLFKFSLFHVCLFVSQSYTLSSEAIIPIITIFSENVDTMKSKHVVNDAISFLTL